MDGVLLLKWGKATAVRILLLSQSGKKLLVREKHKKTGLLPGSVNDIR
ncbi:MAG: hypothetical protein K0R82_1782 [Flavipsychrobacter sp.]|jgi:hypothetical protein|nr:hypothetical protein [Flavipsychrobacter sp.]